MQFFEQFASTEPQAEGGILGALGIDGWTLLFQAVAFLLLLFVLKKFVFPTLISTVDKRQAEIEAASKAADEAAKHAEKAEKQVQVTLKKAQSEAAEIVTTAREEAAATLEASEKKARARSESIVKQAREQIELDVSNARKTIHNDTIELVALATEKIANVHIDHKKDKHVIEKALKEIS